MKRFNHTIVIVLAALTVLAAGCKKESDKVTLGARIAPSNAKLWIDGYTPTWHGDEWVKVNGTAYPVSNTDGGSADIEGVESAEVYYAFYPDDMVSTPSNDLYAIELPATQTYEVDGSGNQRVRVPMSAKATGTTLTFHNLCSVLKVRFANSSTTDAQTLKSITVTAGVNLSGTGTAGVSGSAENDKVTLTSGSHSVTLDLGSGVQVASRGYKDFYIVLPEFSNQVVTIEITNEDDAVATIEAGTVTLGHNMLASKTCSCDADDFVAAVTAPEGAISGLFSVSGNTQVWFSQGNLQYKSGTGWRFAESQYDYVGAWNTSNWVDLFGWGTWTGGASNPTNTSTDQTVYSWNNSDFTQTLANGSGTWRTLSSTEWKYLFSDRTSGATVNGTSNAKYTKATINTDNGTGGVKGVILFPDGVTIANGEADTWGTINGTGSPYGTQCTAAQWTALEAKGCVFLPAAGHRNGTTFQNNSDGYYWSKTNIGNYTAHCLSITSSSLNPRNSSDGYYERGYSVRLVQVKVNQ